jgi:tRNA 2-thiouridine synthesizing protein A
LFGKYLSNFECCMIWRLIHINKLIDCVGEICPVPLVKAQIQYKKINPGESITIVTDHSCTPQNLKEAFEKLDCEITLEEEDGIWEITIRKLV